MAVAGIAVVKDEADIIEAVVGHMLGQVDFLLVADNRSADATRRILEGLAAAGAPLTVFDDDDPGHWQSRKLTSLAQRAASAGAEWVVPFDADEAWYSPFGRISDVLGGLGSQWLVAEAALYDHVATGEDDTADPSPLTRVRWRRRDPSSLPKVACRTRADLVVADGNHRAHYDGGATVMTGQLVVRHYPYRSPEQMAHKARTGAAALAATDLPNDTGIHWRHYAALLEAHGDEAIREVFLEHFWSEDPRTRDDLIYDPVCGLP